MALFFAKALPLSHGQHDAPSPKSGFWVGASGGMPMACAEPAAGELIFIKHGSWAFVGTDIEVHLRNIGATRLVIAGAAVKYCVASSVRMAAHSGLKLSRGKTRFWLWRSRP